MRNSFSLTVFSLLVLKSDVLILYYSEIKTIRAASKMKLILLTTLVIEYTLLVFADEQYAFPPRFQKPNPGAFGSDSSIFLPPESHTPVPYYPIKNVNNLPFPYLPPTGTKAPQTYPSPFPVILSSTLVPIFEDDDDKEDDNTGIKIRLPSPPPSMPQKKNVSESYSRIQSPMKRDMRAAPKQENYHNPIDRIDMRFSPQFSMGPTSPNPINATPRNFIIDNRNDHGFDNIRSASSQNPHYVAAPGFTISSTTEPAIPILRLSNEMDLDGSFSYEALGADQTHYVQHSHMENLGPDKQEQVVEGSYSYVGDNGQTYTVHYIADSNGFRASGDHLPVAPPIPEIIQRAVQYNLAEEARKPPHLRGWQQDETAPDANERVQQFVPPPTRNLFTGRTPEAFSYSFSQGSNNENNLAASPSSQVSVKSNNVDQSRNKPNSGPIIPQITFVASQGAHMPSANQQTAQQSISRVFTNEKSNMPQLINYEASMKEAEQEANKGLWRWQYGLNNNNNANQTPEKNTISRSFGEGDDIMINFGDMTPDQYTKMLQSQLESNVQINPSQFSDNTQHNNYVSYSKTLQPFNQYQTQNGHPSGTENFQQQQSSLTTTTASYFNHLPERKIPGEGNDLVTENPAIISTPKNYNPTYPSVTQTNYYEENPYESRRIKALHVESATKTNNSHINSISNKDNDQKQPAYSWSNNKNSENILETMTSMPKYYSTPNYQKQTEFQKQVELHKQTTEFRPIHKYLDEINETTTVGIEKTTENLFRSNIFLKSLLKPKKSEQITANQIKEEPKYNTPIKLSDEPHNLVPHIVAETKADKLSKFIPYQPKPYNEIKGSKKKNIDLSDVINYITMKNHFESSKIGQKSNSLSYNNFEHKNEMRLSPNTYNSNDKENDDYNVEHHNTNFRKFNQQEHEELRGMIKNYKVLQRANNAKNSDHNGYTIRKELTPPAVKMLHSAGLPPLGRAGPSMKTYLPPTFV